MALHKLLRLMTLAFAGEGYLSEPSSLLLSCSHATQLTVAFPQLADFMGNEVWYAGSR
jgi:hypothetical protein